MIGIVYQYKIKNKYYVGKTYMLERKRIDKHKYEAYTKNSQTPFCRAIRKYGWDEVLKGYSVIERMESNDVVSLNKKLIEREAYWIQKRNSVIPNGYNIYSKGTATPPTLKNKEEMYSKVSKSLKGKYMNHPSTSKRVYCIEQDKWYASISEAERQNGIARGSINKVLKQINVTAGGLTWSYDGSTNKRIDKIKASRKAVKCIETNERFESVYSLAKTLWGDEAMKKKSRIQNGIKNGWAVDGLHYTFI